MLPELGSGELMSSENGRVRIRFASGERNFMWSLVATHLSQTDVAPARGSSKAKAAGTKTARKRAPAPE
jgi:hypothetical protein